MIFTSSVLKVKILKIYVSKDDNKELFEIADSIDTSMDITYLMEIIQIWMILIKMILLMLITLVYSDFGPRNFPVNCYVKFCAEFENEVQH